jgi:signal recognition particle receptor subunit beta
MVFFNYALRKLNAKIVYYGPGLCGKTTNLQWIHDHFEGGQKGKMISLATEGDRTIFFDLLPLEIGTIRGMEVTLQLYTVPGQVHYNSTRQLVLRGADGVVFVADSQRTMQKSNEDSFRNLRENLMLQGIDLKEFPHVLQFNKRDLRDLLSIEEMDGQLNGYDVPIFEATATEGVGVQETLEGIVKLVMRSLRDRYETVGAQEPKPPTGPSVTAGAWPVAATAPPRSGAGPVQPPRSTTGPVQPPPSSTGPVQPPRPAGFGPPRAPQPPEATTGRVEPPTAPPDRADTEDLRLSPPTGAERDVPFTSPDDEPTAVMDDVPPLERPEDDGRIDFTVDRDDDTPVDLGDRSLEPPLAEHEWAPSSPFADEPTDVAEEREDALDEHATAWPPPPGPAPTPSEEVADEDDVPFDEAETAKGIEFSRPEAESLDQGDRYVDSIHAPGPFAPVEPEDEGESPFEFGPPPRREAPPAAVDEPMAADTAGGEPDDRPAVETDEAPARSWPDQPAAAEEAIAEEAAFEAATPEPPHSEPSPDWSPAEPEGEAGTDETSFDAPAEHEAEAVPQPEPEPPTAAPPSPPPPDMASAPPPAARRAGVDDLVESVLGSRRGRPPEQRRTPPPAAAGATREPITVGDGDPFADESDDEARVEPAPPAELLPRAARERSGMVNVEAHDNQLQLRLQGTGAIAESGQVRELDIQVPVPGAWVGHKRVTLQLRLTLTPAPEDEDVENGGDS